jgi:hypothetical protein
MVVKLVNKSSQDVNIATRLNVSTVHQIIINPQITNVSLVIIFQVVLFVIIMGYV